MRILAIWVGTLFQLTDFFMVPLLVFGAHPEADMIAFLVVTVAGFFGTAWGIIYLIRIKSKGPHEKIGLGLNTFWLLIYLLEFAATLLAPKPH